MREERTKEFQKERKEKDKRVKVMEKVLERKGTDGMKRQGMLFWPLKLKDRVVKHVE